LRFFQEYSKNIFPKAIKKTSVCGLCCFVCTQWLQLKILLNFPQMHFTLHEMWTLHWIQETRHEVSRFHRSTLKGEIYDSQIHTLKTKNIVSFVQVVAQHWTIMGSQVPSTRILMPDLASTLMLYLKILLLDCKSQMQCNNGGWNLDFKWKTNWWTLHSERIDGDVALLQAC